MLANSEFKEILNLFANYKIRYLIVDGYAVMKYSEPRFTKDLDVWIATDPGNAHSVYTALREFGAPLENLTEDDFTHKGYFYQMGRPPLRIDIMMSIPGVDFENAWENRVIVVVNDLSIPFISKHDLIQAKKVSGRPQDKIDLEKLREAERLNEDI